MSSTDVTGLPPRSRNLAGRKARGRIFEGLCTIATLIGVGIFLVILIYLFAKGIGAVNLDLFTKTPKPVGEVGGGVANAIGGTLLIVAIAMVIALPLGIGTGTYLAEFGHGAFANIVRTVTDVLTGVPSIVIGILAY